MSIFILFSTFAFLVIYTVPIAIALGIATLVTILSTGNLSVDFLVSTLITSVDSFPIMAVPFFILAGDIMGSGGISQRLVNFANSLVKNITGGFAIASIITCMFFAAISGSGPATVAAVGGIMIPAMIKYGYDRGFATAVVTAAGAIGVMIPPSIPMVMYGVSASTSIGDLFIAGVVPGLLVTFCLIVWAYIYSKKKGYKGSGEPFSLKEVFEQLKHAQLALLIPVIILGGIYGGIFTPTEASVVAVVYGLVVSLFVYKEITFKDLPQIFTKSVLTSVIVLLIVGTATAFGKYLALEQIPTQIANAMLAFSDSKIVFILLMVALLLVVGCFMETVAAIIILTPILVPVAMLFGFNPVHIGIIMVVTLAIGFITPPLGLNLFVGSSVSGISVERLSKAIVPFFVAMLIALLFVIFIPQLSLALI
ncbi:TRAP transporter large permease [Photobacterium gaetbulicola]|uniref:TRAP transporter large permease protein n=1 Tax=Photobacterium gaetbulicola Gung47 TaxID=658445 RepID=A0A0C5WE34_9GAMM|nr:MULTISPECIES: TRAP transporter large permease [Photobacterium]AJR05328.1 C4-dicarboxylate transport system (permease large protein) [Photobacterium gaetbulicola Gung47]PSU12655.1 TRAP transporter large permease [Photobacterium gaetbulicola]WEM44490.1 TRAP transporter large permease [Photobacterium sp. DA100]